MASLRDQIADRLRARLAAIPGWFATMRNGEEVGNSSPVLAVVALMGESKRPVDTLFYACTLRLQVSLIVRREDADPVLDGGNPVRYLDRIVATAERAVHAAPWPNEEMPTIEGHEIEPPSDSHDFFAYLSVQVDYRHNLADPDTYNPSFTA
jgi:hypothetical protein